jgi:hypothetical protein
MLESGLAKDFFKITVSKNTEEIIIQIGKGRPRLDAKFASITKTSCEFEWEIDDKRLKKGGEC